jgi:hypothetical protein
LTSYDEVQPNAGLLPYRVGQLESFRRETTDWREAVDKERVEVGLTLNYLREDVKTIKRVAITLLVAMVTGSASVTIAVLVSTGKVGH